MPGTLTIDTNATFQAVLLMASGPKLKFGSTEQDISARGERKWDVQAAVTYHAEPGMKPISEVIAVTVTGPAADPCASIPPGTPIVFDRMRVGFSVPEARENGRGIRGGRPWYPGRRRPPGSRAPAAGQDRPGRMTRRPARPGPRSAAWAGPGPRISGGTPRAYLPACCPPRYGCLIPGTTLSRSCSRSSCAGRPLT
jgi:hypothetical protein